MQRIQAGTPRLRARKSLVDVLTDNLVAALCGEVAELQQLILNMLFRCDYAAVKSDTFHYRFSLRLLSKMFDGWIDGRTCRISSRAASMPL